MENNNKKIIECDFFFLDSVSHSWGVTTMKMTDLSILYKWKTLKNRQCINTYLPHCMSSYIQFYFHLYSLAYSRKTYNLLYRKSQQLECLYQTIIINVT